jgi:hypothetical protein
MKEEIVDSRCRICFELNPKVDSYCEKSENGSHRLEQYSFPGHKGRPGKEGGSSPRGGGEVGGARSQGFLPARAVQAGDIMHSQLSQEPMLQIESVHQARAPGYMVLKGKVLHSKFSSSFPMGQWSGHRDSNLLISREGNLPKVRGA